MSFRFGARGAGAALAVWAAWAGAAAAQSFVQDFNTLPGTGATSGWSDNTTLPSSSWTNNGSNSLTGWFSTFIQGGLPVAPGLIRISDGSTGFGSNGLYSFGATGLSERALGAFTGLQNGSNITDVRFGFRYTNNTGSTINSNSITLAYTAEHWRDSTAGTAADKLLVETLYDPTNSLTLNSAGFANATNVTAPQTGTGAQLNGNLPANQSSLVQTFGNFNINPGESVWFRWTDTRVVTGAQDPGALAIDNLTFTVAPVPEPAAAALAAAGMGALYWLRRRKAA